MANQNRNWTFVFICSFLVLVSGRLVPYFIFRIYTYSWPGGCGCTPKVSELFCNLFPSAYEIWFQIPYPISFNNNKANCKISFTFPIHIGYSSTPHPPVHSSFRPSCSSYENTLVFYLQYFIAYHLLLASRCSWQLQVLTCLDLLMPAMRPPSSKIDESDDHQPAKSPSIHRYRVKALLRRRDIWWYVSSFTFLSFLLEWWVWGRKW